MSRVLIFLLLPIFFSCGKPSVKKVRLGIAAQQSISQVPVYLAHLLGTFEASGVVVELAEFAGASKGMEALIGGSIDVLSGYYTQGLQIRQQGRSVDAFLSVYDSLLIALAVSPASSRSIRSIQELAGAKVGVTTLGSATHQYLNFLLRSNGMKADSVTPIAIGTASRAAAAMERGVVDAGIVTDFTIRYLERRFGEVRLLSDTRTREGVKRTHGTEAFPGTVLLASSDWLNENRESARKVAEAVSQAMSWMRSHSAVEIAERMPQSHYGEDREAYEAALSLAIPLLSQGPAGEAGHRAAAAFLDLPVSSPSIWRVE